MLLLVLVTIFAVMVVSMPPAVFVIFFPDINFFGRLMFILPVFVILRLVDSRWRTPGGINAVGMMFTVSRHIDILVPAVIDKIDRPATSVVFAAVFVPFFSMARRYAEINRRIPSRYRPNNDRFSIDQARCGIIADVDVTVIPRFSHTD
jgi:hypothetical protein